MRHPEKAAGPGKAPRVTMSSGGQPIDAASVAPGSLAVDARGLAVLLGCSERHVRALNVSGRLPRALRLGRRRVWSIASIEAWLAAGAPTRAAWEMRNGSGGAT